MSERLSIDEIIADWEAECSVDLISKSGFPYRGIPSGSSRRGHFLNLVQTLLDQGYSKEEIKTGSLCAKVVNTCWPDKERSISAKELRTSKAGTRKLWEQCVRKVIHIEISKYEVEDVEPREPAVSFRPPTLDKRESKESKEDILEEIFNPKDRIISIKKIDRSNDTNWELLEELGLEPDEAKNE